MVVPLVFSVHFPAGTPVGLALKLVNGHLVVHGFTGTGHELAAAERCGVIHAGDIVLGVDGASFRGAAALELLLASSAAGSITMHFQRFVSGNSAKSYRVYQFSPGQPECNVRPLLPAGREVTLLYDGTLQGYVATKPSLVPITPAELKAAGLGTTPSLQSPARPGAAVEPGAGTPGRPGQAALATPAALANQPLDAGYSVYDKGAARPWDGAKFRNLEWAEGGLPSLRALLNTAMRERMSGPRSKLSKQSHVPDTAVSRFLRDMDNAKPPRPWTKVIRGCVRMLLILGLHRTQLRGFLANDADTDGWIDVAVAEGRILDAKAAGQAMPEVDGAVSGAAAAPGTPARASLSAKGGSKAKQDSPQAPLYGLHAQRVPAAVAPGALPDSDAMPPLLGWNRTTPMAGDTLLAFPQAVTHRGKRARAGDLVRDRCSRVGDAYQVAAVPLCRHHPTQCHSDNVPTMPPQAPQVPSLAELHTAWRAAHVSQVGSYHAALRPHCAASEAVHHLTSQAGLPDWQRVGDAAFVEHVLSDSGLADTAWADWNGQPDVIYDELAQVPCLNVGLQRVGLLRQLATITKALVCSRRSRFSSASAVHQAVQVAAKHVFATAISHGEDDASADGSADAGAATKAGRLPDRPPRVRFLQGTDEHVLHAPDLGSLPEQTQGSQLRAEEEGPPSDAELMPEPSAEHGLPPAGPEHGGSVTGLDWSDLPAADHHTPAGPRRARARTLSTDTLAGMAGLLEDGGNDGWDGLRLEDVLPDQSEQLDETFADICLIDGMPEQPARPAAPLELTEQEQAKQKRAGQKRLRQQARGDGGKAGSDKRPHLEGLALEAMLGDGEEDMEARFSCDSEDESGAARPQRATRGTTAHVEGDAVDASARASSGAAPVPLGTLPEEPALVERVVPDHRAKARGDARRRGDGGNASSSRPQVARHAGEFDMRLLGTDKAGRADVPDPATALRAEAAKQITTISQLPTTSVQHRLYTGDDLGNWAQAFLAEVRRAINSRSIERYLCITLEQAAGWPIQSTIGGGSSMVTRVARKRGRSAPAAPVPVVQKTPLFRRRRALTPLETARMLAAVRTLADESMLNSVLSHAALNSKLVLTGDLLQARVSHALLERLGFVAGVQRDDVHCDPAPYAPIGDARALDVVYDESPNDHWTYALARHICLGSMFRVTPPDAEHRLRYAAMKEEDIPDGLDDPYMQTPLVNGSAGRRYLDAPLCWDESVPAGGMCAWCPASAARALLGPALLCVLHAAELVGSGYSLAEDTPLLPTPACIEQATCSVQAAWCKRVPIAWGLVRQLAGMLLPRAQAGVLPLPMGGLVRGALQAAVHKYTAAVPFHHVRSALVALHACGYRIRPAMTAMLLMAEFAKHTQAELDAITPSPLSVDNYLADKQQKFCTVHFLNMKRAAPHAERLMHFAPPAPGVGAHVVTASAYRAPNGEPLWCPVMANMLQQLTPVQPPNAVPKGCEDQAHYTVHLDCGDSRSTHLSPRLWAALGTRQPAQPRYCGMDGMSWAEPSSPDDALRSELYTVARAIAYVAPAGAATVDPNAWRTWSGHEQAQMANSMDFAGKWFAMIGSMPLGGRSPREVVQFYYSAWKRHPLHRMWRTRIKAAQAPIAEYHNDTCECCGQGGSLLMCDSCNLSFHPSCLALDEQALDFHAKWSCPVCRLEFTKPSLRRAWAKGIGEQPVVSGVLPLPGERAPVSIKPMHKVSAAERARQSGLKSRKAGPEQLPPSSVATATPASYYGEKGAVREELDAATTEEPGADASAAAKWALVYDSASAGLARWSLQSDQTPSAAWLDSDASGALRAAWTQVAEVCSQLDQLREHRTAESQLEATQLSQARLKLAQAGRVSATGSPGPSVISIASLVPTQRQPPAGAQPLDSCMRPGTLHTLVPMVRSGYLPVMRQEQLLAEIMSVAHAQLRAQGAGTTEPGLPAGFLRALITCARQLHVTRQGADRGTANAWLMSLIRQCEAAIAPETAQSAKPELVKLLQATGNPLHGAHVAVALPIFPGVYGCTDGAHPAWDKASAALPCFATQANRLGGGGPVVKSDTTNAPGNVKKKPRKR